MPMTSMASSSSTISTEQTSQLVKSEFQLVLNSDTNEGRMAVQNLCAVEAVPINSSDTVYMDIITSDITQEAVAQEDNKPGKNKRKKKAPQCMLTAQQEEMLADWYQQHPLFYDQVSREFRDRDRKDRLMEEKAAELGITGKDLSTYLTSMRTMFNRLKRNQYHSYCGSNLSADGTPMRYTTRQSWILQAYHFLAPHLLGRRNGKSTPTGKTEAASIITEIDDNQDDNDEDDDDDDDNVDDHNAYSLGNEYDPLSSVEIVTDTSSHFLRNTKKRKLNGNVATTNDKVACGNMDEKCEQNDVLCGKCSTKINCSSRSINDARTNWARWLGSELCEMSEASFAQFQRLSFDWIMTLKKKKQGLGSSVNTV